MVPGGSTASSARSIAGLPASAGNSFSASAPAASRLNASAGVKKPGMASRPRDFGGADDGRVGMRRHDQPAAGLGDLADHARACMHRAGADQRLGAEAAREALDAEERVAAS